MKEIQISCSGNRTAKYCKLNPFQGELKSLSKDNYKKLKKQILDLGFSEPISCWENEGNYYVLNGHQRLRVIKEMVEKEGYRIGPVPINLVDAKDEQEAKRKILALTSQFGKIEDEGLYEFVNSIDIKPEELTENFNFSDLDLDKFVDSYFDDKKDTSEDDDKLPEERPTDIKMGDVILMEPYWECDDCGDRFEYEDGKRMNGTCPCG